MSELVEITRYPNRRFYDRSQAKYVTLGDIEEIVLGGGNIKVRDSKSNDDLTRLILTQILVERHPERLQLFPVAFLHSLLRADSFALEWLRAYFGQSMTLLENARSMNPISPNMDLWRPFMPDATRDNRSEAKDEQAQDPQDDSTSDEVDLANRLGELERRLRKLEVDRPDQNEDDK